MIPLHWLTFAYMSWQAAVPTVTIVHNLQYHALVWFHNRNRYGTTRLGRAFGRIPSAVGRSLLAYVGSWRCCSVCCTGFRASQLGRMSDLAFGSSAASA